ncbi:MAG: biotin/lipoyl-containing protein [Bacillota bacterium]
MRNFNVTVNGKSYSVQVEESGAAPVAVAPVVAAAPVAAAAPAAAPAPAPAAAGANALKAPLPGMIVDFKVASGATVKKGDVVLILEAMKMENDVCAHADGVINFVVAKGATVETDATLATIG